MNNKNKMELLKFDYLQKVSEFYKKIKKNLILKTVVTAAAAFTFLIPFNPAFGDTYEVSTMEEFNQLNQYVLTDLRDIDETTTVIIDESIVMQLGGNIVTAIQEQINLGRSFVDGFEEANTLGYSFEGNFLADGNLNIDIDNRIISSKEDIEFTRNYINSAIMSNIDENTPDHEKIRMLYELAVDTFSYGTVGDLRLERNLKLGIEGNPIVCQAYSKFMYLGLEMLGFEHDYVKGKAGAPGNQANWENHLWNIVKVEGNWYHVDSTWGDGSEIQQDAFFLVSDSIIASNHSWTGVSATPETSYVYVEPVDPPVDPEEPPVDPEEPPVDPEDPPVDPEDPPVDPEEPPVDPEEPPVDPEEPPVDPEEPPVDPEDPPVDPEDPPVDPEDPPVDPEEPPVDPEEPPVDPEEPPVDPEEPPVEPEEPPVDPEEPPVDPEDPPVDPEEPPVDPEEPPVEPEEPPVEPVDETPIIITPNPVVPKPEENDFTPSIPVKDEPKVEKPAVPTTSELEAIKAQEIKEIKMNSIKSIAANNTFIDSKSLNVLGRQVFTDVQSVVKNDNYGFSPVKFIAEALGYNVTWHEEYRKVTLKSGRNIIRLSLDSNEVVINGKVNHLISNVFALNGRTYVNLIDLVNILNLNLLVKGDYIDIQNIELK